MVCPHLVLGLTDKMPPFSNFAAFLALLLIVSARLQRLFFQNTLYASFSGARKILEPPLVCWISTSSGHWTTSGGKCNNFNG
jgi:hypothetical protein